MGKTLLKWIAALLLLCALALMVPCAMPYAAAEELPVYSPVTLEAESVEPLDYLADSPYAPHEEDFLPDGAGYLDPSISVRVERTRAYNSGITLVWVQIADPSQLRSGSAAPYPSKAQTSVDVMARRCLAVLAVNGDNFLYRRKGYIVRNGDVLRDKYDKDPLDTLIIDSNGDFTILQSPTQADFEAFDGRIMQTFAFGPGLVINGEKTEALNNSECSPRKRTQRIALAQMDHLSYLIIATDGPDEPNSTGLTLNEFAQLVYDLHPVNAYNMDGGSSSNVVLHYEKINASTKKKFRSLCDTLYFATALPGEPQPTEIPWTVEDEGGD